MSCPLCGLYGVLCDRNYCGRTGVPLQRNNRRARDEDDEHENNASIFGLLFFIPYIAFMFYFSIGYALFSFLSIIFFFIKDFDYIHFLRLSYDYIIFSYHLLVNPYLFLKTIIQKIHLLINCCSNNKLFFLFSIITFCFLYYSNVIFNMPTCGKYIRHRNGTITCL